MGLFAEHSPASGRGRSFSRKKGPIFPNELRRSSAPIGQSGHQARNFRLATIALSFHKSPSLGKLKTHHLVNVHTRNEDLQPSAGSTAHRQLLTGVQGVRGANSKRQIEANRHVAEGDGIIVEVSVLWALPDR